MGLVEEMEALAEQLKAKNHIPILRRNAYTTVPADDDVPEGEAILYIDPADDKLKRKCCMDSNIVIDELE